MRRRLSPLCNAILALLCLPLGLHEISWAAELKETWHVEGGRGTAPELVCPRSRRPSPPPPSQPSDMAPPDAEELAALETIPDRSGATEPLPVLALKDKTPPAIAIWGDSHTAAGFFSEQLLDSIGLAQDDAAPSFIPPTVSRPGVRLPLRKSCRGGPWQTDLAYTKGSSGAQFGRALARAENTGPGAYLWLDFRRGALTGNLKELEILFTLPDKNARAIVKITIDDRETKTFRLSQEHSRILIKPKKPFATAKLTVESGSLFLDGFVPTYADSPKLLLDTLSIPGATARAWKTIDPTFLRHWGATRPYDLAFLQYGTNEGNSSTFNLQSYRDTLRESLRGFRASYPDTTCLLIGPTDRGVLVRRTGKKRKKNTESKNLLFYSRRHYEINQAQAEIGKEFGCQFWSWQRAMGGPGSIYRWQRAKPPLANSDLVHLTKSGYQESARRFEENVQLAESLGFTD